MSKTDIDINNKKKEREERIWEIKGLIWKLECSDKKISDYFSDTELLPETDRVLDEMLTGHNIMVKILLIMGKDFTEQEPKEKNNE